MSEAGTARGGGASPALNTKLPLLISLTASSADAHNFVRLGGAAAGDRTAWTSSRRAEEAIARPCERGMDAAAAHTVARAGSLERVRSRRGKRGGNMVMMGGSAAVSKEP